MKFEVGDIIMESWYGSRHIGEVLDYNGEQYTVKWMWVSQDPLRIVGYIDVLQRECAAVEESIVIWSKSDEV